MAGVAPCNGRRRRGVEHGMNTGTIRSWAALAACVLSAVWPGVVRGAWAVTPPPAADATRDAAANTSFTAAADYSTAHSGRAVLVMKGGEVVFERYDGGWTASRPHALASGTKSFTGVLAMFAVQDGLLTLDEKACETITEWKEDPRKSKITVRHLLTLSSGLDPADALLGGRGGSRVLGEGAARRARRLGTENSPPVENHFEAAVKVKSVAEPGEKFMYGPSHFYAFGELLERKLRASDLPQKTVMAYMQARLFDPIGVKVGWFGKDAAGKPALPGGCLLTAREWAKFGEFVRLNGGWKQTDGSVKSLLRPELLAECFKPSASNASYGLTWWLRNADPQADGEPRSDEGAGGEGRSARDRLYDRVREREFNRQSRPIKGTDGEPITVYMAAGLGKQRLYIIPAHDLVVVRFAEATTKGQRFDDRRFLEDVLRGVTGSGEKPATRPAP